MTLSLTQPHFVVLMGPPGCGKSSWAKAHFPSTAIISSDHLRECLTGSEESHAADATVFQIRELMLAARAAARQLSVVDSTHCSRRMVDDVMRMAAKAGVPMTWVVFDVPLATCLARNAARPRQVPAAVIRDMHARQQDAVAYLRELGATIAAPAETVRLLPTIDREAPQGVDVIGDVHGCAVTLRALLTSLGYDLIEDGGVVPRVHHPEGRLLAFVGDLVDRGPDSLWVLQFVRRAVADKAAECVAGNHDVKLARALRPGATVVPNHGLAETLAQIQAAGWTADERADWRRWLLQLPLYRLLGLSDGRTLVLVHAGLRREMLGRTLTERERAHCIFGEVLGYADGFPVRGTGWRTTFADDPSLMVVHGHVAQADVEQVGAVINVDSGCAFGGQLSALQLPAGQVVQVASELTVPTRELPVVPAERVLRSTGARQAL